MGILVQRKQFDHIDLATEAAKGFLDPAFNLPGIETKVQIDERAGAIWLTLCQKGEVVTGDEPLLPDYERVEVSDG